jgi:hypothetical protein
MFPNPNFPWVSGIQPTNSVQQQYNQAYQQSHPRDKDYSKIKGWYGAVPRDIRHSKSLNVWGVDQRKYDDLLNHSSRAYWSAVLVDVAPASYMNYQQVASYLAGCMPNGAPCLSFPWKMAIRLFRKAVALGDMRGWTDDAAMPMEIIQPELIEALRIAGDLYKGLGSMPPPIAKRLRDSGLIWLLHDPKTRTIPKCWEQWARQHGMQYKIALPTMATTASTQVANKPTKKESGDVANLEICSANYSTQMPADSVLQNIVALCARIETVGAEQQRQMESLRYEVERLKQKIESPDEGAPESEHISNGKMKQDRRR